MTVSDLLTAVDTLRLANPDRLGLEFSRARRTLFWWMLMDVGSKLKKLCDMGNVRRHGFTSCLRISGDIL